MSIFSFFKKKRERTLVDLDKLNLGNVDREVFKNYELENLDIKPFCPNCKSDNLTEVYPRVEMAGKVLHTCLDCQERCYL